MATVTREAVVGKASSYLGMMERTGRNDIWFADDWGITGYSWCFAFVQSCFYYAGAPLPLVSMYCPTGVQYARDNGQAIEVGQGSPMPGDIVFFSWDMATWPRNRAGTGDHVGIVEAYGGGDDLHTIEGNIGTPQGVYRKTRSISATVVCFWRPPVFSDDDGGFAVASFQEDEDLTPAQEATLTETRDLLKALVPTIQQSFNLDSWTWDRLQAVDTVMRDFYNNTSNGLKGLDQKLGQPEGAPVLDVEGSLKTASAAQLLAALSEALKAPTGRVSPPAPPA